MPHLPGLFDRLSVDVYPSRHRNLCNVEWATQKAQADVLTVRPSALSQTAVAGLRLPPGSRLRGARCRAREMTRSGCASGTAPSAARCPSPPGASES